jgi:hypothetical protein
MARSTAISFDDERYRRELRARSAYPVPAVVAVNFGQAARGGQGVDQTAAKP